MLQSLSTWDNNSEMVATIVKDANIANEILLTSRKDHASSNDQANEWVHSDTSIFPKRPARLETNYVSSFVRVVGEWFPGRLNRTFRSRLSQIGAGVMNGAGRRGDSASFPH